MTCSISCTINGEVWERDVAPHQTLADFLRDDLGLTGTKVACGTGDCGACSVLLDGALVTSCLVLAAEVQGRCVLTVEGLALGGAPNAIQEELVQAGAVQCGFCTPGVIVAAHALLRECPDPTEKQVRAGLAGNLCRCTGYQKIVQAVRAAAPRYRQ